MQTRWRQTRLTSERAPRARWIFGYFKPSGRPGLMSSRPTSSQRSFLLITLSSRRQNWKGKKKTEGGNFALPTTTRREAAESAISDRSASVIYGRSTICDSNFNTKFSDQSGVDFSKARMFEEGDHHFLQSFRHRISLRDCETQIKIPLNSTCEINWRIWFCHLSILSGLSLWNASSLYLTTRKWSILLRFR